MHPLRRWISDVLARPDDGRRERRLHGLGIVARGARRVGRGARRHPGVAVVLAVVLVLVGPLIPDLWFAIPWPWRKRIGQVAFAGLAILGLRRLMIVRPTDRDEVPGPSTKGMASWPAWALLGICALLAIPLLPHPDNLGFFDWDLFLGKHEAARRTILEYHQFPWWDPWTRGGFPLAANPQCGVLGVAMPLVLIWGTSEGMRLATLIGFFLACEGTRRLAALWLDDPWAALAAGLIYGLNGGVLVSAVEAYHVVMCYPVLPWSLYHLFLLERRPAHGLALGFWSAYSWLNGIQYFTVYMALIVAVVWLRRLRVVPAVARSRLVAHSALALGMFLALAGWRVSTTSLVMWDFPRPAPWAAWALSPGEVLDRTLSRPSAVYLRTAPFIFIACETTLYLGPIVAGLVAASLARGWRWWHWLALLCGWLAAGSIRWFDASYWLSPLPLFRSMAFTPRWRFMAALGLALAAASAVARARASGRAAWRRLAALATLAIAADYLAYGFEVLPVAFHQPADPGCFPGPPVPIGQIVQVHRVRGFPAIRRGYGVIHGYEPLVMSGTARDEDKARLWLGHPDYVGEHWTARGPVRPLSWSPNRIVLQVAPGEEVFVNQRPGSWWLVNGRPGFPGARCAEPHLAFRARADATGRVVLEIRPAGLELGWWLHGAGGLILLAAWAASRRQARVAATLQSAHSPGGRADSRESMSGGP